MAKPVKNIARSLPPPKPAPSQLPDKIGMLLHESRWIVLVALALLMGAAFWGYHPDDPGWSHSARVPGIANPVGGAGAWLSDLFFYLFGRSAWWWVVLLVMMGFRGYRRLMAHREGEELLQRPTWVVWAGFLVLLLVSSILEALRFHTKVGTLPLAPGGMIGSELGQAIHLSLGATGTVLILLALLAIGWSLFVGMSWLMLCERVGTLLEAAVLGTRALIERWEDRRIGRELARERDEVIDHVRKEDIDHPPIVIEMPPEVPPVSPKAEKKREKERIREAQPSLFEDHALPADSPYPPLTLLDPPPVTQERPSPETIEFTSRLIERKLGDFGVKIQVLAAYPGPVITRYEIEPATGVKGSQIVNLSKDLARALSMISVRVVETVPGKSCMALELPNPRRQTVRLSEIIGSPAYQDAASALTVTLGKDISGLSVVADLAKMPHLLVAGTTGSGKSVGVNAMILSLLYKSTPEAVRLIMVDPKMLELSIYEGIPHLLCPVVTDMKQAANALSWSVGEMERRYKLMSAMGVRNLAGFNTKIRDAEKNGEKIPNPLSLTPEAPEPLDTLPHIVIIIDELADLMMVVGKKIEELIARLAQKARAAGIHLILATQRPSVDVITGLIKANIPTRIAFQVSSKIDSRTILDQMGAEALLGQGDMLYLAPGTGYPTRVHGAFVADEEVHKIVDYLKRTGAPDYIPTILAGSSEDGEGGESDEEGASGGEKDPLYDQAVEIVLKSRKASISLVQRHLRIGYNRSARLVEAMEQAGLVSAMDGRGGREVLAPARAE